jgi:hypothetical protein
MSVLGIPTIVMQMQLAQITMALSPVLVTLASLVMGHTAKTSMNVVLQMGVATQMQNVPTRLDHFGVLVTQGTLEMEHTVIT